MKYIFIILVMMLPVTALGVDTIGKLETGYDPWFNWMFVEINIGIPFHLGKTILMPYFGNELWVDVKQIQDIDNNIISNEYKMGATLIIKDLYFGIEHRCFHPQQSDRESDYNTVFRAGVLW